MSFHIVAKVPTCQQNFWSHLSDGFTSAEILQSSTTFKCSHTWCDSCFKWHYWQCIFAFSMVTSNRQLCDCFTHLRTVLVSRWLLWRRWNSLPPARLFCARDTWYTHRHTQTRLTALFPGPPEWAGIRKVKPIWILLKQETASGSGIGCMQVCTSLQTDNHASNPPLSIKALKG